MISNHPRKINDNKDINYDRRSRIDDLNDTLLELIFTRLVQWRHLVTCKCVSKRWNSIISNPDFARYLNKNHSPFALVLRDGGGYNAYYNNCLITEHPYFERNKLGLDDIIPIKSRHINRDIVAYHNDILVICHASMVRGELAYYITNPFTKQFIVVTVPFDNPQYRSYDYQYGHVGFAGFVDGVSTIDVPNSKNIVMGFRIIRTITTYGNILIGQIYSSETGKWKKYSVNDLGFKFKSDNVCPVTLNNKVHWRGRFNKILVVDPFVDDDNVSYCVLILPSEIHKDSVLGSCRNRLRIAQFKSSKFGPRIKVWEFDDCGDRINMAGSTMARLTLIINLALKPNLINLGCKNNKMICCHPNDPDIVYFIYKDKLVECDVVNNIFRVISDCTKTNWLQIFMLVYPLLAP